MFLRIFFESLEVRNYLAIVVTFCEMISFICLIYAGTHRSDRCLKRVVMSHSIEYDEVLSCRHVKDRSCYKTFVTVYKQQQVSSRSKAGSQQDPRRNL